MENLLFTALTLEEKLYWYHYFIWMEFSFSEDDYEENFYLELESSRRRWSLIREAKNFAKDVHSVAKNQLIEHIDPADLLLLSPSPDVAQHEYYNFEYLSRDWSNSDDHQQRKTITEFIENQLQSLSIGSSENALFIGCGNGRYAVDFSDRYEKVRACDKSLMMIWTTLNLKRLKKWDICHKIVRNCRTVEDSIQRETVEMSDVLSRKIDEKVEFMVGDVANIRLEDCSVQHIYSIYFTDVLPLKALWSQIDRLLTDQGLFIHFGPLEYFFSNELEMLTTEEICDFFVDKDYTILANNFLETPHLFMKNSMRHRFYDNWFFIARKNQSVEVNLDVSFDIHPESEVVKIVKTTRGKLIEEWSISNGDLDYDLPEMIADILCIMDGEKSLRDLLYIQGYEEIENEMEFISVFKELYAKRLITVRNGN